jgi:hypothetical protein
MAAGRLLLCLLFDLSFALRRKLNEKLDFKQSLASWIEMHKKTFVYL